MRTEKIKLYSWCKEPEENIDIDWPKVHKRLGIDCVQWILSQAKTKCQLTVESGQEKYTLVLEFYCEKLRREYAVLWAK